MSHSTQPRSFGVFYVIGALVLLGTTGLAWKHFQDRADTEARQAREKTEKLAAGPAVVVAKAVQGPDFRVLNLVGEAVPVQTAVLYSRIGGYLKRILVDVGDTVRAGQVIAEIEQPELDAQTATIATDLDNKRRLARRARELHGQGFFSQQALDNAENDVRVAQGRIGELRTLAGYRTVRAPFAGTITERFVDAGALITNASSNQTAAQPIVAVAQTQRLKVTVYAEQAEAPLVRPGLTVEIADAADPGRRVSAKVTRVSGELDARTRTRRAEVEFDNPEGLFLPGGFVNVALAIPAASFIEVPAGALVTREKRSFVAMVDDQKRVHYLPIEIAGTDGKVLRVAKGLEVGTPVAVSPPAGLADGARIDPQPPGGSAPPRPPIAPTPGRT